MSCIGDENSPNAFDSVLSIIYIYNQIDESSNEFDSSKKREEIDKVACDDLFGSINSVRYLYYKIENEIDKGIENYQGNNLTELNIGIIKSI